MSKDIHIQAFQFLGGNKGDLEKSSNYPASREWQEIVDKLASKAPNVFPTCPSQREIEQAADLSFINVPMIEPGMRAHTVYFAIQAVGGRAFFNVLCFAYHEREVSLRVLAALAPSDWWFICMQLTPSDTKLTLPEKYTETELPEWDGKKALFFRVPGFGGRAIQGEFEDWREPLNLPSHPPYQPVPSPKPKYFSLKKIASIARPEKHEILNKIYKRTMFVLAIIGLIAGPAVPYLIWQNHNLRCDNANKIAMLEEENAEKGNKIAMLEEENAEKGNKIAMLEEENKKLKDEKNIQNCTSQKSANMIEQIKNCWQYLPVKWLMILAKKFSN